MLPERFRNIFLEKVTGMADKQILTKESLAKYQAELENLKLVRRKEVAKKIQEAREQGDLSENAEYDAALEEQRDIEARIAEVDEIINNAEALDVCTIDNDKILLGRKCVVTDKATKKDLTFQIVDKSEIDVLKMKISYESPVGQALMYQPVGKEVKVETPGGTARYKIKQIIKAGE